jgi:Trk K+ transport system NAD-binding subunit
MQQHTRIGPKRVVVVGCTDTGASAAVALSNKGHSIQILDEKAESFQRIPAAKRESGTIVPVIGDGTSQRDLLKVSIRDADVFMALSDSDTMNALACELASSVFQVPTVVSRIDDPSMQATYNEIGIAAIGSAQLLADIAVEAALR